MTGNLDGPEEEDNSADDWDDWGDLDAEPKSKSNSKDISVDFDDDGDDGSPSSGGRGSKGHFTAWEDQVIRSHWETSTDEEIARRLGRSVESIARRRKMLNLYKGNGRPRKASRKKAIFSNPNEHNLSKLSKEDRLEFYKSQFDKNPRYPWLERTLLDDELEYYKIKYIEFMESLDTITHQEEDLLHNMIMKEIQITRIQTQIKEALEEHLNRDEDDDRGMPQQYLYGDLDKAEQQYIKYQEKLRITREQRLKIDKEEKLTISSLMREFLDRENRQRAGDIAGQLSYFTSACKDDMLKSRFLLGE